MTVWTNYVLFCCTENFSCEELSKDKYTEIERSINNYVTRFKIILPEKLTFFFFSQYTLCQRTAMSQGLKEQAAHFYDATSSPPPRTLQSVSGTSFVFFSGWFHPNMTQFSLHHTTLGGVMNEDDGQR